MAAVCDILSQKQNRQLQTTTPGETVLQATKRMDEHGIGALLVLEEGRLVGIFTERDVLRRVVAEERAPAVVKVGEVMSRDIACATKETSIDDARNMMRTRRIRHLPIVSAAGSVEGVVSIGDLNAFHSNNQEVAMHYLQEYLHGRV